MQTACVGFTPDGEWLVTGTGQHYQSWKTGTWEQGWTFPRENAGSVGGLVAFAPDGHTMAVRNKLGTMELLDWRTGRSHASLLSPRPQGVHDAAFSPDGGMLALLGDAEVQIWDFRQLHRELGALRLDWSTLPERPPRLTPSDLVFRWLPDETP